MFKGLGLDGVPQEFCAAATAGFLTVAATAPLDFTRTRLMAAKQFAQQSGVHAVYSGSLDVVLQTLRKEGPFAFYKGAFPQWLRIGPYTVMHFLAWERLCRVFGTTAVG
jgi:solute carrier family 25 protein 14/30